MLSDALSSLRERYDIRLTGPWIECHAPKFKEPSPEEMGWDIHISVADEPAQEALLRLAHKYKLQHFQVTSGHFAREEKTLAEAGSLSNLMEYAREFPRNDQKRVAYYFTRTDTEGRKIDWKALIREAETIVKEMGAGVDLKHCKAVPRTSGIYYRNYLEVRNRYGWRLELGGRKEAVPDLLDLIEWPHRDSPSAAMPPQPLAGIGAYEPRSPNGAWIYFKRPVQVDRSAETVALVPHAKGWKVHISVASEQGQHALVDLAHRYKLPEFKISDGTEFDNQQNPKYRQSGKTVVFYYSPFNCEGKPINWVRFLEEAGAVVEKWEAGPDVQRDARIPGTNGLFYRHPDDAKGKYVKRDDLTRWGMDHDLPESRLHNLAGRTDFLKVIGWPHGKAPASSPSR